MSECEELPEDDDPKDATDDIDEAAVISFLGLLGVFALVTGLVTLSVRLTRSSLPAELFS